MEVEWLLVIHGLVTLLVLISFLCGQWPIFAGTFIQKIHFFLTFGACDYFRRFVGAVFGQRGSNALFCVEYYCCDRPNPTLQVIYLGIIGASYYLIVQSAFKYIPGHYLGEVHRYISLLAVGGGILLFLLTSFSDPGTVNAGNVSHYLSAYPYDNIIFSEKECPTCKIPKPARSKHCSICDRCVARFDHHCGWMNNCIGEKNSRYFMAFLLWHFLLCLYGAVAIALVLAGRLKELRVIDILTVYYGFEKSFSSLAPHVAVVSGGPPFGFCLIISISSPVASSQPSLSPCSPILLRFPEQRLEILMSYFLWDGMETRSFIWLVGRNSQLLSIMVVHSNSGIVNLIVREVAIEYRDMLTEKGTCAERGTKYGIGSINGCSDKMQKDNFMR
ncbi:hypothetical protein MTR67_035311 [Solanum verrucosum]|uniref:S-acyltransferase n=1 Tax=Solanum verrucosum TaxID=315347 RepID=A0AAF0ZJQ8_SOLVR|nr:hypothetical protein MTR67_035311 [Solanum verrucosum]